MLRFVGSPVGNDTQDNGVRRSLDNLSFDNRARHALKHCVHTPDKSSIRSAENVVAASNDCLHHGKWQPTRAPSASVGGNSGIAYLKTQHWNHLRGETCHYHLSNL